MSIPIRELVVGDLIDLAQGDRVPADCILVEEMKMSVDQSMYYPTDEGSNNVQKESSKFYFGRLEDGEPDNHK